MKYKLIIEGTKAEIEEAKTKEFRASRIHKTYGQMSATCYVEAYPAEVEFRIVEPKYRVKTLGELAEQYGNKLHLTHERTMVSIYTDEGWGLSVAAELGELGKEFIKNGWSPGEAWKKIFLKEVE